MRRPSPSMIVSIVAVVLAGAGTSIAAVNFAKNAGAVDGKSAVGASVSNAKAAGKLVATGKSGKIPAKFLDRSGVVTGTKSEFGVPIEVVDNAEGSAVPIGGATGVGLITVSCLDQNQRAGVENPQFTLRFANGSAGDVNFVRSVDDGAPTIAVIPAGTTTAFSINADSTFRLWLTTGSVNYVMQGVVRQTGTGTAAAGCEVYGYALAL